GYGILLAVSIQVKLHILPGKLHWLSSIVDHQRIFHLPRPKADRLAAVHAVLHLHIQIKLDSAAIGSSHLATGAHIQFLFVPLLHVIVIANASLLCRSVASSTSDGHILSCDFWPGYFKGRNLLQFITQATQRRQ